MSAIETYAVSPDISGKRFLAALGTAVGASAVTGALSYVLFRFLDSSSRSQAIVFIVYTTLVVTLCAFFRPVAKAPIGLRFTSLKHLLASVGLLIATLAVTALFYRLMSPVFGDFFGLVRQIAAFATDAKRLQGQPVMAWIIATPRGVLLVPLFEEVLFRGLLLAWLRKHLRENLAVISMAALFALEHGSFAVAPYAFLLGITMGYVKLRTGSILNTFAMHFLNNVFLLAIGLKLFGHS
ncbi:CPBP family intramembrane glutamic endopeptidase [Acidisarcina polymorpha]|uniref:CPBP family intramembrane glutamic endopeptidase n=1 Tax=Acidisarcina polymorpha TaxID=2211140 RepID=UPI000DEF40DB|nr:CPBP family intramembrane glutamic endopeptidase [Acidisarcina polymorpha]